MQPPEPAPPPYLAGLRLAGRRVVLVGGGSATARRVHRFLAAGADVLVVAPTAVPAIEALDAGGRLRWERRAYADGDLDDAWYAMAATDDAAVNTAVGAEAERRRVFCVRADAGGAGSAVTPAVGGHEGLQVGVLAAGDHRRSARVRDELVDALTRGGADATARPVGVALVGGGPGDPELITVRGARLLAQADVVVADRLAPGELLERVRPDAEVVDASKIPYGRQMAQQEVSALLVARVREGKFVVRLKGGDPFVFGRGYEELVALTDAGVQTVVVPGVSSALAGPALAGVPVTQRGEVHEVVVVSGHLAPGDPGSLTDWDALGRLHGTVVVLMGLRHAPAIAAALLDGGREPHGAVALVADASLPTQRRVDTTLGALAGLADAAETYGLRSPVLLVVGPTARFGATQGVPHAETGASGR